MELAWMPGPGDAARELQLKQYNTLMALYDVSNALYEQLGTTSYALIAKEPTYIAAKALYEASVVELVALLGEDAHCNEVDCDLFSTYSDIYKSDVGFRPRSHVTRAQAQKYLDNLQDSAPAEQQTSEQ